MVFVTPAAAADGDLFHRACALLRKEDPVHLVEHDDYRPFWAITKHADVNEIEVHPREFQNAPQPLLMDHEIEGLVQQVGMRMLIHMDDPDHKAYRAVTADWFKRSGSVRLKDRVAQLARQSVDQMAERGGFCDFAIDIAMPYPLQVILSILGLPDSDYPRMLQLTQELFGYDDPEQRRGFSSGSRTIRI
jgi:cytochrome P450